MRIKLGLHNHSQMSDGELTVSGLLRALKEAGYDVVAITDHNTITIPHPLQLKGVEDLLILRGVEVTFPTVHIIVLEPTKTDVSPAEVIDYARVSWLAHPQFSMIRPDIAREICTRANLNGVELYNSGYISPWFSKWDWDLNFYAVDDVHIPSQIMTSWMEMEVDSLDKDTVIEKLISGDFWLFNKPRSDIYDPNR